MATSTAHAQSSQLSQAVLALPSTTVGADKIIENARLFGGIIQATITNQEGTPQDFLTGDRISFRVQPRTQVANLPTGAGFDTPFVGTKAEFEAWARRNANDLLRVLFPAGLASGLLGRDASQLYSQEFLLTTALSTDSVRQSGGRGRYGAGGLLEYERFSRDGAGPNDSAWAWQGMYVFTKSLSLQGRFAQQQESLTTRATTMAVDYHPFIEMTRSATWRVGATARGGFQYATSHGSQPAQRDAMTLGSVDVGGGGWMSVRKDFRRLRIGGGTMFQGTKSQVPAGDEGTFRFDFAQALNDRGTDYDLTYGATVGFDTSVRTAVTAKYADSRSVRSGADDRPGSRLFMTGLTYALAPGAVLSGGYKITASPGFRAHSMFFQGNYGW
jgi:hypothetical protein